MADTFQIVPYKVRSAGTDVPPEEIQTAINSLASQTQTALNAIVGSPEPPSGPAGGDLSGTYPNPTVAKVHATSGTLSGVAVTTSTVDSTPVGATTASTGAFTTLTATTPVGAASGGTGQNSLSAHNVLIGEGTGAVGFAAPGVTAGVPLVSNGSSVDPSFGTASVSGGGTGLAALTAFNVLVGNGTGNVALIAPGAAGIPLTSRGAGTNPAFQGITVPGGGTGLVTIPAHGVMIGEGTGNVATAVPGTANFALLSTGASSDPTFQQLTAPMVNYLQGSTGSVTRTQAAFNQQFVSVKDFGAVGNGVTNDTTAVNNAIAAVAAGGTLYFPPGNYLVSPASTFTGLTFVNLVGAGMQASTITLAATGTAWTFSNCQNVQLIDLAFTMTASVVNATSVNFSGTSGNCRVLRCWFFGMSQDGLQLLGVVGAQMSGHIVEGCLFLSCARYGINSSYSNDFKIDGNQFGILVSGANPTAGMLLDNSSAGTLTRNYHWSNSVGLISQNSSFNAFIGNRYEINLAGGVTFQTGGADNTFVGNRLYSNSQTSSGTTDNLVVNSQSNMLIESNNFFTWDATTTRYGINLGAGNTAITLKGNRVSGYATNAYNIDSSLATANIGGDNVIVGGSGVNVASATTAFIGQGADNASANPVNQVVPVLGTVIRLRCFSVSAPGAGQTFVYTLYKNGVATGVTCTTSGAGVFGSNSTTSLDVAQDDLLTVQVVASATATASIHFFSVSMANR